MSEYYFPINLPSKALPYENIKPEDITVRAYQGADEIYLAEINPVNIERKFLEVLKNVVRGIDPENLTLGDRLYIIVWEYAKSYSEFITVKNVVCTHCLKEIEVNVDLTQLDVITLPDNYKQPYKVQLPSGNEVQLRLLTIKDEIEAEKLADEKNFGHLYRYARSIVDDADVLSRYRYARSIVDDADVLSRLERLKKMSAKDVATIRAFHEKFYHGPDMKMNYVCPECEEDPYRYFWKGNLVCGIMVMEQA